MNDRAFLDTNILIYLYSQEESNKPRVAQNILNSYYCVVSLQTLNELSNVWAKKYYWDSNKIISHLNNIDLICDELLPITRKNINYALKLKDIYQYSYYDCLILSSALEGHCKVIFTEDMKSGQIIEGGLLITNPFI